jgi:hypothetical protein
MNALKQNDRTARQIVLCDETPEDFENFPTGPAPTPANRWRHDMRRTWAIIHYDKLGERLRRPTKRPQKGAFVGQK